MFLHSSTECYGPVALLVFRLVELHAKNNKVNGFSAKTRIVHGLISQFFSVTKYTFYSFTSDRVKKNEIPR